MPELCEYCRKTAEDNVELHDKLRDAEKLIVHWKALYQSAQNTLSVTKAVTRSLQLQTESKKLVKRPPFPPNWLKKGKKDEG